jgi:peptide/nickel transport system permease protein
MTSASPAVTTMLPAEPAGGQRRSPGLASHPAVRLAARLIGRLVLVLFGVLTLLFLLLHSAGNPADAIAGQNATPAQVALITHEIGFDRPLIDQYGSFLWDSARFDFGNSFQEHTSATGIVMHLLPATLELILLAYLLALIIAIPLGLLDGLSRSRVYDGLMDIIVLAGQAIPVFASGTILVYLLAVKLAIVPSLASNGLASGPGAVILPIFVLAMYPIARILEVTRSGLRDSMQEDFIRTAESKGVSPWRVVSRHASRPVLTSLVTVIGVDFAQMLSGGVLVEVIFAWPGMGPELVNSVSQRDYPVVAAATYCFAVIVVVINLATDLLYRRLDPRLRRT